MADFTNNIERINRLAEQSEGFVWRLEADGDGTYGMAAGAPDVILTLSVWESLAALRSFVFKSDHAGFLRRRREWFLPYGGPYVALWWLPDGTMPTLVVAMAGAAPRRRPTMTQVARAAGVSVMTVSYAYSQPDRVSPEALVKVREAAGRVGYPGPHPGARSLRRGRAGSVGVVLGEHLSYAFDDPQAARFLAGVADVCASHGLGLMLLPITGGPADVDRVFEAAVDGFVVWTTADDDPVVDAVAATGLPAVVHGGPRREGLSFVAIDDLAAARAVAAEAFATARRPAVLSFPLDRARTAGIRWGPSPDEATFRVTRQRLRGMRHAWRDLGGDWSQMQVVICASNSAAEAEQRAAELLTGPDAPDAVVAMSDELALGVLRAADHLSRRIPGDLTVTGWDDTSQAAPAGLTTIAQSLRDQGAHCARLALDETPDHPYKPDWTLITRESTSRVTG